jgi:hypothetical protein
LPVFLNVFNLPPGRGGGLAKADIKVEKEKLLVAPKLEKVEGQQESPEISSTQGTVGTKDYTGPKNLPNFIFINLLVMKLM